MTAPTLLDGPSSAPATGAAPRSLVILLHGYGSNGADLIGLGHRLINRIQMREAASFTRAR
jgi:predicted esterase